MIVIDTVPLLVNGKVDRQALLKMYENTNNNGKFVQFEPLHLCLGYSTYPFIYVDVSDSISYAMKRDQTLTNCLTSCNVY